MSETHSDDERAASYNEQFQISDREFQVILGVLPASLPPEKVQCLRCVLEDWCLFDLPEHRSRTQSVVSRERLKRLKNLRHSSEIMIAALDDASGNGEQDFVEWAILKSRGRIRRAAEKHMVASEIATLRENLIEIEVAAGSAYEILKPHKGRPPNDFGYLVFLDLAALFEWLTGKKSTRRVDRDTQEETGPFHDFAKIVWPMITNTGSDGFATALRRWAESSKKFKDTSAVLANFRLRNRF